MVLRPTSGVPLWIQGSAACARGPSCGFKAWAAPQDRSNYRAGIMECVATPCFGARFERWVTSSSAGACRALKPTNLSAPGIARVSYTSNIAIGTSPAYTYTYTHTSTDTCAYVCTYIIYLYFCFCVYTYTRIHPHLHLRVHVRVHAPIPIQILLHIQLHRYILHLHIQIHQDRNPTSIRRQVHLLRFYLATVGRKPQGVFSYE